MTSDRLTSLATCLLHNRVAAKAKGYDVFVAQAIRATIGAAKYAAAEARILSTLNVYPFHLGAKPLLEKSYTPLNPLECLKNDPAKLLILRLSGARCSLLGRSWVFMPR
jgi:hypothetical protein